jgi:predicted N-acetyltransferase YhbS
MSEPIIRKAKPGEERAIHEAHMRSIREVCVKDHGIEEVSGWGNRPLGDRWIEAIENGDVLVVEFNGEIHGHGFMKIIDKDGNKTGFIQGLYLTAEVIGMGLGRKLTHLLLEKARLADVKTVALESTITAHGFYKKLGFKDAGPMVHEVIGGHPVRCIPMTLGMRSEARPQPEQQDKPV